MKEKNINLQIVTLDMCSHCKSLKNYIEEIKEELKKKNKILINYEILDAKNQSIYKWAKLNKINKMPTTLLISENNVKKIINGFISKELYINSIVNHFLNENTNKINIKPYIKEKGKNNLKEDKS